MPDDEWDRFLKESVEGTADAPREPSARSRIVARRLREEPAPPTAWRAHNPPPRPKRTGWYAVALLVVVALLAVALFPQQVTGWFGGDDAGGTPLAQESERPTGAPPRVTAERPTRDEPFRGSPAGRWASGVDGITMPAAKATGWMSTAQVQQALRQTRDFLVASNLDPGVLRGERPARAIALMNPHQKDVQDFLSAAFSTPGEENDPLLLFSRFDQRARLVGDDVRTRGRISYAAAGDGALRVTTDVTYVYPVAPASGGDEVARTIVRREVVLDWNDPKKVITEPGTFSLVSYSLDMTNGGCGPTTGLLTPQFAAERSTAPKGGPEVDPYDRSRSIDERTQESRDEECGTATRS
ncbi:hypothetical protein ACH41E_14045 [Streptomyces sp. NPDC020412]|uniref:hypothetical protein n=1 Tax=Streptomyces sp. NPDC020412 TaxID=3365073 RepID=UPI0037975F33